jgi:hypothetical protein
LWHQAQRRETALQEDGGPDARPVLRAEALNVEGDADVHPVFSEPDARFFAHTKTQRHKEDFL